MEVCVFPFFPWFPSKGFKLTQATFIKAARTFDANGSQRNKLWLTLQSHGGTAKTNFQPRGCLYPPLYLTSARWCHHRNCMEIVLKRHVLVQLISCQHAACKSRQSELSRSCNPRSTMCAWVRVCKSRAPTRNTLSFKIKKRVSKEESGCSTRAWEFQVVSCIALMKYISL